MRAGHFFFGSEKQKKEIVDWSVKPKYSCSRVGASFFLLAWSPAKKKENASLKKLQKYFLILVPRFHELNISVWKYVIHNWISLFVNLTNSSEIWRKKRRKFFLFQQWKKSSSKQDFRSENGFLFIMIETNWD